MKNVVAALFEVESEGFQAFSKLRKMADENSYSILQMALVKKEDGKVNVCESFDSGINTTDNTIKGGLIGGLIGILGGPLGVLLMGSYGALAGSLIDMGDAIDGGSMIEMVVDKMQDGTVALVIVADELNESVLDAYLKDDFKVTILRFDAALIEDEINDAVMMEEELARQARVQLRNDKKAERAKKREERRAKAEEKFDKKIDEMARKTMENSDVLMD